jgi:putative phosphoribosyl transferase
MLFFNRESAGIEIANILYKKSLKNAIVVALPRGGVPVAIPIASALKSTLKLIMIRKIGHPINEEYAIGAVSLTDLIIADTVQVDAGYIQETVIKERKRIKEMVLIFNHQIVPKEIEGNTVILVDDGIATGYCMKLAIKEIKKNKPGKLIVSVPVCSLSSFDFLSEETDEILCLQKPASFWGIGSYYQDFSQLTDEDIISLLNNHHYFKSTKKNMIHE